MIRVVLLVVGVETGVEAPGIEGVFCYVCRCSVITRYSRLHTAQSILSPGFASLPVVLLSSTEYTFFGSMEYAQ